MYIEVCRRKVDTPDGLVARISNTAAARSHKETRIGEEQLRRTTRHLRTRFVKCTGVDGGILGHLL